MTHCRHCGRCCWNFKEERPWDKCEQLADDLKTCRIHDDPIRERLYGCVDFPKPHMVCDLPEDCGFVIFWKEKGIIG